jgi:ATP-dependent exoDNAse (exonuclease V) beta subunit
MISPAPLLDQEARRTFIEALDDNFCVSAGAGVGKTTAITRRIANLALRHRQQPDLLPKLVVVTYGKLAAEELRVRPRDLVLQQLEPSALGRQNLLAELRGAFFGTIHSFCLKLIRDQGRFLNLPENVGLLADADEPDLWAKFCESDALNALNLPPALLDRVSRHLTFDQLLSLARRYGPDEAEIRADFDPAAPPPDLDFSAALDDDGGRSKAKTLEHQTQLRRWLEEFDGGAPFLKLPEFKGGSGSFLAAVDEALLPYARWLNDAAGSLVGAIARAYRDYRLEKGLMTYRDQVFWCRRLLANPAVLKRLRSRGYIVILDEAQDTDADMFAILTEITRPPDASPGAWPEREDAPGPEPGRFCFVGDDQQAIYSERADLRVYRAYVEAFRAGRGGKHLEFCVTMRCPRRVVGLVNAVFANDRLPQPCVEFRELAPRPDCLEGDAWRMELGGPAESGGRSGVEARLGQECARIADFLAARGPAGLGVARWSEAAVICPRVSWLEQAARIFAERRLPGCLLSQKKIARELARHSWPAALLHVLLHPWDRFELIGVLREIFAVSDVDLARLHRRKDAGLTFWPDPPPAPHSGAPSARLRRALTLLHELRAALPTEQESASHEVSAGNGYGTLSRYVDLVLEKTALAARLEAIGEPAGALERLRVRALQAECDGAPLRAWVRSLVDSLEEPASAQPGAADAIQFLTCLKAKGLEWPVVIPLGLGCQIRERTETYPRVERQEGVTQIHFSPITVDPEAKAARAARGAEEFQRMLYVTFTRAKRLLIAPDSSRLYEGRAPNFLQLARWPELDLPALFSPAETARSQESAATSSDDNAPKYFEEDRRRLKRAAVVSHKIPRRVLPSGLVHGPAVPVEKPAAHPTEDLLLPFAAEADDRLLAAEGASLVDGDEPLTGIGGIDYGNWWHGVLQRYPWTVSHPDDRAKYLREERAKIAGSVAWTSRAADELSKLAASEAHAEFLQQGKVFLPEAPFSYPREANLWIEGIMDLVIVTRDAGQLWIIDWKTDRRRSSDADEAAFLARLAEKYGPQLRAYAEVFARGFKRPVSRLLLYSTVLGKTAAVKQ